MRLRPYKSCDANKIINWIRDEEVFHKWGGDHSEKKDPVYEMGTVLKTDQ